VIINEYLHNIEYKLQLFCDFSTKFIRYKFTVAHFMCFITHSAISMCSLSDHNIIVVGFTLRPFKLLFVSLFILLFNI